MALMVSCSGMLPADMQETMLRCIPISYAFSFLITKLDHMLSRERQLLMKHATVVV